MILERVQRLEMKREEKMCLAVGTFTASDTPMHGSTASDERPSSQQCAAPAGALSKSKVAHGYTDERKRASLAILLATQPLDKAGRGVALAPSGFDRRGSVESLYQIRYANSNAESHA